MFKFTSSSAFRLSGRLTGPTWCCRSLCVYDREKIAKEKEDALFFEKIRDRRTSREILCLLFQNERKNTEIERKNTEIERKKTENERMNTEIERKNTENERKNTENVKLKAAGDIAEIATKLLISQKELSALAPRGILGLLYDILILTIFQPGFSLIYFSSILYT